MKTLLLALLSLILVGCNSAGDGVKILTSGIFSPVLFSINEVDADGKTLDYGERLLTDSALTLNVQVHNDTEYPYTDLKIDYAADGEDASVVTFFPSPEGNLEFPGYGGTCKRTLNPGQTCLARLQISPRDERTYKENILLSFKNFVKAEEHKAKIVFMAGMPASLVFTNDITQYTFGNLIGTAQTPVVERADGEVYERILEIKNAGGLPAKSIVNSLKETCTSTSTNLCPTGMDGAYSLESSCPKILPPRELCTVRIIYKPKNQDPASGVVPDDIKEILYRATIGMTYIKDPYGGEGALNAYFKSYSTNIEARFKVAVSTISFDTPIVSGNRDLRSFRINNTGYREGSLQTLAVRDSGGTLMATCKAGDNDYLDCFKTNTTTLASLAEFPFTFKDRNKCLVKDGEDPVLLPVGGGCVFDVYFQPSLTYVTDMLTQFLDLQPEANYDSHWKGNVTLRRSKLFNLSAKSKALGRLVLDKITYDGVVRTFTGANPWTSDFGRMTLQSPNFYKRKALIVAFKNVGSVEVSGLAIKDALNRTIPVGGTAVNLGAKAPYFFSGAIASDTNCTIVGPGETCSFSMLFAPIGMDTNTEEDANMFDATDVDLSKYKGFIVAYSNGSLYTDNNRLGDPNIAPSTVEARIKTKLVRKGMLMQLNEDTPRNFPGAGANINVAGDTVISHIYLRNIGTGAVPYFRLMNPPSSTAGPVTDYNYTTEIIPTTDPASLGAEYDCLAIGDEDYTYNPAMATALPSARSGLYAQLPKEESCVYTIKFKLTDFHKGLNATNNCSNTYPLITSSSTSTTTNNTLEGSRLFARELESDPAQMWEFCSTKVSTSYPAIKFQYYDGDSSDPALPAGSNWGNRISLNSYNFGVAMLWPAKIIPYNFLPTISATLYRPGYSLPQINTTLTAKTIAPQWFYGALDTFSNWYNDPAVTNAFVQGDDSRDYVQTTVGFSNKASYDYVLYIGSFPQNSGDIIFPIGLKNAGQAAARVMTYVPTYTDSAFEGITVPVVPQLYNTNADVLSSYRFKTNSPGEKHMELEYTYRTGAHLTELIYKSAASPSNSATMGYKTIKQKILVIGNVEATGAYPFVKLDVNDYEVVQNPGSTPTETIQTAAAATLTWLYTPPTTSLVFDTIKLTSTPTTSDVYAKKKLTFTNNSTLPLTDFKVLFRADAPTTASKTLPTSFKTVGSGAGVCSAGQTLAAGASCTITLQYQPLAADTTDAFVMTAIYKMAAGKYTMQNVGISLMPQSPGVVIASGKTTEPINYKATSTSSTITRTSYGLNFGTINLDAYPKILNFNATAAGTYQRIQLTNAQATKASLLLSYHKYVAANSLRGYTPVSVIPTSLVPAAGEYRDLNGVKYVPIFKNKDSDGNDRMVIEAAKGCLFGDDETNVAVADHKKGFNNTTTATNACYLVITFNMNFDYLKKAITTSNGDDMRGSAAELWYYSVNRSSTSSLWMHIKGTVNPDVSIASGVYANIQSFDTKVISLTTQKLVPNNAALGSIVGLRVLMAASSTALSDPYSTALSYVDIRPYDGTGTQVATFNTGLANGTYYYFRVIAIRKDTRFTDVTPKKFVGLNANEYLSGGSNNATPLKVLVPPTNYYYWHDNKLLVEKVLHNNTATYDTYTTASEKCTKRTALVLKDPANVSVTYKMINKAAWDLLVATPAATSYTNMTQIPHWLSDATVSIDSKCSTLPGYLAGQTSQMLNASSVFYLRNSSAPTSNVNIAIGGVPGTTYAGWISYVNGATGYGSPRCMINLP